MRTSDISPFTEASIRLEYSSDHGESWALLSSFCSSECKVDASDYNPRIYQNWTTIIVPLQYLHVSG